MVQKFSMRRPSLETRLKVLKLIASECGVTLDLEEDAPENEHEVIRKLLSHNKREPLLDITRF